MIKSETNSKKICIGVDLGTTNTCAGIVQDNIVSFLELEPNSTTMPSAVRFVNRNPDDVKIGRLAKRFAITKPKEVFISFKTLMQNEEWLNDPKIVEHYKIGDKQFTPSDIAALILSHIYKVAQESTFATEGAINNIMICVPAASTAYYKKEVIKAALQAGFGEKDENGQPIYNDDGRPEGIRLIEEPFAAAYSYGLKHGFFDPEKSKDQNIMVYDFGGGTFDVSIINVVSEKNEYPKFTLLGTYGVTHLGGDDIDYALMKIAAKQFYKETKIDLLDASKDNKGCKKKDVLIAQSTLKELCERAKIDDFAQGAPETQLQQLSIIHDEENDEDCNLDIIVTKEQFIEVVKPLLDKTIECANNALRESNLTLEDINRFVLVGGSTKGPWVQDAIKSYIEKDPYIADNVDVIVGEGAAYYASHSADGPIIVYPPLDSRGDLEKGREQEHESREQEEYNAPDTIKNKTSQYLGVEIKGGYFIPLVAKGLPFDEEHPSYSGSIKCTNPNDSGSLYITGWSTQEDILERDQSGEPIKDENGMLVSTKSVHYIKQDGSRVFTSLGHFCLSIPKADAHSLDITLTLTVLKDNSLKLEVKVGDDAPIVHPW